MILWVICRLVIMMSLDHLNMLMLKFLRLRDNVDAYCNLSSSEYVNADAWKVARMLKCPASKFIAHTVSNLFFLLLISMATFSTYQYSPRAVLPHEQSGEGQEVNSIVGRESLYYLTSCQHLHLFVQSNSNYRSRDGEEEESEDELSDELELLLRNTLRSCNALITKVHICLLLYILGGYFRNLFFEINKFVY